ncbi:MAG: hypothetical protein ABIM45_06570 [candidate division WOR-3 bacterium]
MYNPLKLLPVEEFNNEFVEKLCHEDILGVALSFFCRDWSGAEGKTLEL